MARRLAAVPGVLLIAAAAAMWGTDALFRKPLAESTSAATIVFGEHVVLVLITLPLLVPAMRALFGAGTSYVLAGKEAGSKLEKARSLGIPIIDENEFRRML